MVERGKRRRLTDSISAVPLGADDAIVPPLRNHEALLVHPVQDVLGFKAVRFTRPLRDTPHGDIHLDTPIGESWALREYEGIAGNIIDGRRSEIDEVLKYVQFGSLEHFSEQPPAGGWREAPPVQ